MLTLTERKDICSLLVQLFSYPDAELSKRLAEPATAFLIARLAIPALTGTEIDWKTLEPAYTSLFINRLGGVPAPPYGSVYLDDDGQVMGASSLRVMQSYQQAGLVVESPEPPDFLATELEFLYFLADREGNSERRPPAPGRFFSMSSFSPGSPSSANVLPRQTLIPSTAGLQPCSSPFVSRKRSASAPNRSIPPPGNQISRQPATKRCMQQYVTTPPW